MVEVPRPKELHKDAKWRKYCHVSEDWRTLDPKLYLDKSDTAFLDYVSCHIKVLLIRVPFMCFVVHVRFILSFIYDIQIGILMMFFNFVFSSPHPHN